MLGELHTLALEHTGLSVARRPWQLGPHRPAAAGARASEQTALWWFVSQIRV